MKPGDLIQFRISGEVGVILRVSTSLYQIDEIEEEVRYLHQNGTVYDRAYMNFKNREYIGSQEFEVIG